MKTSTQAYLVALHEIIHTLLSEEAGTITPGMALMEVSATARLVPNLDRAWRKEIENP